MEIEVIAIAEEKPVVIWRKIDDQPALGDEFAPKQFACIDEHLVDSANYAPITLTQNKWEEDDDVLFSSRLSNSGIQTIKEIVKDMNITHIVETNRITLYKNLADVKLIVGDGEQAFPLSYLLILEDGWFKILQPPTKDEKEFSVEHLWDVLYASK